MENLLNSFVRNPVAANMLMFLILAIGGVALVDMRIEGFPKIPPDTIEVTVVQIGASAQQVEESVTQSLEEVLEGLPGAKSVSSISAPGYATIYIKKLDDYKLDRLLEDVKLRIDNVTTLPLTAERPQVRRAEFNYPALIVQIFGNVGQEELQKTAVALKQRLLALPEVSQINQWGERIREISIEIPPETLKAYQLSLDDVAQIVQQNSVEYRTGELKSEAGRIQLRSDGLARDMTDLARIPVFVGESGSIVYLDDIAVIRDGFEDSDVIVEFQGEPAIGFEVAIGSDGNLLKLNDAVNAAIASSDDLLTGQIQAAIWANQSSFAEERLNMLSSNALQGLLLVFLVLSLFLNFKLAFWVAIGIPVALAGTIGVMGASYFNYSLNDITTFGMILVLGILVDDAVVVSESVYESRMKIDDPHIATRDGVERVLVPTVFGVLTTIAAFYPMTVLNDPLGKVFGSFAVIVIIALLFSLIESKLILPSHLAETELGDMRQSKLKALRYLALAQGWVDTILERFIRTLYRPLLEVSLAYRWQTLFCFFAVMYLVTSLVSTGVIRTTFFPEIPGSIITVKMETDSRIQYDKSVENSRRIVAAAKSLNKRWQDEYQLKTPPIEKVMLAVVGASSTEIYAELSSPQLRPIGTLEIVDAWRKATGQLEGVIKLEFSGSEQTAGGFQIDLFTSDSASLDSTVNHVLETLSDINGVKEVWSNIQSGKPELRLQLNERGMALGLDGEALTRQVSNAYGGVEIQRFQRGTDEVKTYARFPEGARNSLHDLYQHEILLPSGTWVPLLSVASIESHYVPRWLWRKNFQNGATISASIDKDVASSREIYLQLNTALATWQQANTHVRLVPAGELEQEGEMADTLWNALLISSVLIYVLLAVPLKSYWQPFIIMSVVPFGFMGAALGHLIIGIPLSVLSFFGMLALAGVVVNDSLVLISRINQERCDGNGNAVVDAACSRFRAIFLTTITTVIGLAPIIAETSEQAQYLIPAAVSVAFGLIFGTLITLILVPLLATFGSEKTVAKSDERGITGLQSDPDGGLSGD